MKTQLTVLSLGGGQESTDLLYRTIYDEDFYKAYIIGKLIVIMSDTGNEHRKTYEHIIFIQELCKINNIEFYLITSDMGFHPNSWPDLDTWMKSNHGLMSKAFPKSCTDNLKIKPIYNFLENYIAKNFFNEDIDHRKTRKEYTKRFALDHGKIRVLIGIAKGEESRISNSTDGLSKWFIDSIERIYPLVDLGIDRQETQDNAKILNLPIPIPSNCMKCPWLSKVELLWLFRFEPDVFWDWVQDEINKKEKWKQLGQPDEKNLGVFGAKTLPEILSEAIIQYGHWTDEELNEYKMSHGHCVKSKY